MTARLPTAEGRAAAPEIRVAAAADRQRATIALMVATALQAADATIVNVALPRLNADLGGGVALGAWVLTGYLCATAAAAPLTGSLRRRFGAQRLFAIAVGGFVAASLLCAAAPDWAAIILFRVLQGACGGVIQPLSNAILLDLYPKERHGRVLALWGAALMVGPVVGPLLGGIITDLASWRWVFAVNLPLGLFAIWGMQSLRAEPERDAHSAIDGLGVALMVVAIAALQLCLQRGVGRAWLRSPEIDAECTLAVAAFALLVLRARGSAMPGLRPVVFRDINFAAAAFGNVMLSAVLFVALVFVPLAGEGPLGFPATMAGLLIVPRALLMMGIILCVGRAIGRVDHRILLAAGWLLMATGLAVLSTLEPARAAVTLIVGSTIQALGAGLLFTPLSTLSVATLAPPLRTDATGLYSLLRQLACASGVALMTAVLQSRVGAHLADAQRPAQALAELAAYRDCFRIMAVACIAVLPAVFLFRLPARTRAANA